MASDVCDVISTREEGRCRGLDIDDIDEVYKSFDEETGDDENNENIGVEQNKIEALLKKIEEQASTIAKLKADLACNTKEKDGEAVSDDVSDGKMKKRKLNESVLDIADTSNSQEKDIQIQMLTERIS